MHSLACCGIVMRQGLQDHTIGGLLGGRPSPLG